LNIALVIAILGFFGVETTTFAALLAAGGVAIGVAWGGLAVPAATPAAVRERLHQEGARILASDDTQQRIRALGVEPAPADSAEAFRGFMQAELEKWGKLVRERKIEAQ